MSRPAIGIVGSCVMGPLGDAFAAVPALHDEFDIVSASFGRPMPPDEAFSRCVALILQDRMTPAPVLSTALRHRLRLREDVTVIRVPNVTLAALWPLVRPDPRDKPEQLLGPYRLAQTDRLALEVMRRTEDPDERRALYFQTDLRKVVDLDRLHEFHAAQMREGERICDVQISQHVLSRFADERLFFACHHPTSALLLHLADRILSHRLFEPFRRISADSMLSSISASLHSANPFHAEQVPIHPQVAAHFRLRWWHPGLRYHLDGRTLTFEEWLEAYMTEPLP